MKLIRNIQFFTKGYFKYTKSDQIRPTIPGTLEGLNYVITGPNSGIGFEAAKFAAKRKANVFMVCRDEAKGQKALAQIKSKSRNQNVFLIIGELGEIKNLDQISKDIKQKVGKIDVLVHNAGCMNHEYKENSDGVETNFATNVLSVYYLTKQLLPCLHQKSKVIVVSSGGMYNAPLVIDDIYMKNQDFDGTTQYARNKRMQVCMIEQFAKMYKDKGVFVTMHPGWVDTPGLKRQMPQFYKILKNSLKHPEQGSDTINYLSIIPTSLIKSGQFYYNRKPAQKHLLVSGTKYTQLQVNELMFKLRQIAGF